MESIYSFAIKRPYIIYHLISKSDSLKNNLNKTFQSLKKRNTLSNELNKNIIDYISFRKLISKFLKIKSDIDINNINIKEKEIKKVSFFEIENIKKFMKDIHINYQINEYEAGQVISNFMDNNYENLLERLCDIYWKNWYKEKKIYNNRFIHDNKIKAKNISDHYYHNNYDEYFIKQYNIDYKPKDIYGREYVDENYGKENYDILYKGINKNIFNKYFKNYKWDSSDFNSLQNFEYYQFIQPFYVLNYYLDIMNKKKEVEEIMDIIYFLYEDYFHLFPKEVFEFELYPNFCKKYRNILRKKAKKENENKRKNIAIKKISKIFDILKSLDDNDYKPYGKKNRIEIIFDFLSTQKNCSLYNLHQLQPDEAIKEDEYLDEKYLNYLEKENIKQDIKLICIINQDKYCNLIQNINYPYIYQLHFQLFSNDNSEELLMFNIPIDDLYLIFSSYISAIKCFKNIKKISFSNEFLFNKYNYLYFDDNYYQSILSYLIDQCENDNKGILKSMELEEINIMDENICNIYEKYKILFGFNKIFPKLKSTKLLQIKYTDLNNNNFLINKELSNYRIINIDFNGELFDNFNDIIKVINIYFEKNPILNNIEIISFINLSLNDYIKKNYNINLNSNSFPSLTNLKEFFINNINGKPIFNEKFVITNRNSNNNNKFIYLYLGYDCNNNIIYYRKGTNKIISFDIIYLLNTLNKEITKLILKHENIEINFSKERTELKIINYYYKNNKEIIKDNIYYCPLNLFSDFIKNENNLTKLIIKGFDFNFNDIKNDKIKILEINYFNSDVYKYKNYFEYKIDINDKVLFNEDTSLMNKFPDLQILKIGNTKNIKEFIYNIIYPKDFKELDILSLKDINICLNEKIKVNIETY